MSKDGQYSSEARPAVAAPAEDACEAPSLALVSRLAEAQASIAACRRDSRLALRQAAEARALIQAMTASASWRLTAPLRAVMAALRGRAGPDAPPREETAAPGAPPRPEDPLKQAFRARCRTALDAFLASGARLALPAAPAPRVSILIIVFNQAELTFHCLQSLAAAASAEDEVVIVDNGSTDATATLLDRLDGARVIRSPENLHFLRGVNRAAKDARGRHLLLLNNDTEVAPGAVAAAAARLDAEPDLGAVGGPIVLLDGTLQEAGAIIWRDGHTQGYGRGRDPDAWEFRFRRDVDYCSGAFLMVRRQAFEDLGGLDTDFAPAYFEETDLCMRLRAAGWRVGYEPAARILHVEYGSAGHAGEAQALYLRNHARFRDRHAAVLERAHHDPADGIWRARARCRSAAAILVLDGDDDAQVSAAAWRVLAVARDAGQAVTLARVAAATWLEDDMTALGRAGIEVAPLPSVADLHDLIEERKEHFDFLVCCGDVARLAAIGVLAVVHAAVAEQGLLILPERGDKGRSVG